MPMEFTQLYIRRLADGEVLVEYWQGQDLVQQNKCGKLGEDEYRELIVAFQKDIEGLDIKFEIIEETQQ